MNLIVLARFRFFNLLSSCFAWDRLSFSVLQINLHGAPFLVNFSDLHYVFLSDLKDYQSDLCKTEQFWKSTESKYDT